MNKRSRLREAYCSDISIPRISDELVMEILSRVGCSKYAIQCKLVSKLWSSLINSSYYMRRWRQINANKDSCLVLLTQYEYIQYDGCGQEANYIDIASNDGSPEFKFSSFNNINDIKVVATHKDVVLCTPDLHNHKAYYLCNPFTMQWTALPRPSPTAVHDGWTILVGLYVYDDTDNYTFKFKVLRIVLLNSNDDWLVEMFSSANGTAGWTPIDSTRWRRIFPTNYRPRPCSCNCISYNGMLVWYVCIEREDGRYNSQIIGFKIDDGEKAKFVQIPICFPRRKEIVLSQSVNIGKCQEQIIIFKFNPIHDGEKTDFVQIPHQPDVFRQSLNIGKCQERLRLSQILDTNPLVDYDPKLKLRIWQFDSQRQKWEFVHELDFSEMEDSVASSMLKSFLECQDWTSTISVMAFHPYDEDIIYLRFSGPENFEDESENLFYIISCDIRKGTFEVIRGFPEPCYPIDVFPLLKPCWPTTVPLLPPP